MGRNVWLLRLSLFLLATSALGAEPGTIRSAIETMQQRGSLAVAGELICATRPLRLFYERRNYELAWRDADAQQLLDAIQHASEDGLRPDDYHLAALGNTTGADRDLLLTDAFFLLGSHLLSGRVDPETIEPEWCLTPRTNDLVATLETALENGDVRDAVSRLAPSNPAYRTLRAYLAQFRTLPEWPIVDRGKSLRKGDGGPRVDQLVARLTVSGDLSGNHAAFDDEVEYAVRHTQGLHGLSEDGVAGRQTLRELNMSVASRIRQLELNLERLRWMPATLGDRYAIINIAEFHLRVIEHGATRLSMRIVVGKAYKHTPLLSSRITQVVFSPYWNVPDSIASQELYPKQAHDHSYFKREHLEVLRNGRLRQTPGPWNSLGLLKFNIPNRYDVYLHDTPARSLFDESSRAFSHGCIRIQKPVELATYLLRDLPGWTPERITAESATGVEHAVDLPSPLPVHVLYWTAFIDDDRMLRFAPDVYARDAPLDSAMRPKPAP